MNTISSSIVSGHRPRVVLLSGIPPARGLSLVFALLALTLLTLAAVALVRSVDTGALVLGNMGFKQEATATGDQVADAGVAWVKARTAGTTLDADDLDHGYVASAVDLDPTGTSSNAARVVVDWANDGTCAAYEAGTFSSCVKPLAGPTVNGHATQYVIVRLCPTTGTPTSGGANDCSSAPSGGGGTNDGDSRNGFDYRNYERFKMNGGGSAGVPNFRVVARVVGGRKSVSYTETIVHF